MGAGDDEYGASTSYRKSTRDSDDYGSGGYGSNYGSRGGSGRHGGGRYMSGGARSGKGSAYGGSEASHDNEAGPGYRSYDSYRDSYGGSSGNGRGGRSDEYGANQGGGYGGRAGGRGGGAGPGRRPTADAYPRNPPGISSQQQHQQPHGEAPYGGSSNSSSGRGDPHHRGDPHQPNHRASSGTVPYFVPGALGGGGSSVRGSSPSHYHNQHAGQAPSGRVGYGSGYFSQPRSQHAYSSPFTSSAAAAGGAAGGGGGRPYGSSGNLAGSGVSGGSSSGGRALYGSGGDLAALALRDIAAAAAARGGAGGAGVGAASPPGATRVRRAGSGSDGSSSAEVTPGALLGQLTCTNEGDLAGLLARTLLAPPGQDDPPLVDNPLFVGPVVPQPPRTITDSSSSWALMVEAGCQSAEAVLGPLLEGVLMEVEVELRAAAATAASPSETNTETATTTATAAAGITDHRSSSSTVPSPRPLAPSRSRSTSASHSPSVSVTTIPQLDDLHGGVMQYETALRQAGVSLPPFSAADCLQVILAIEQLQQRLPITIRKRAEAALQIVRRLSSSPADVTPDDVIACHTALKGVVQDCVKALTLTSLLGRGSRQWRAFAAGLAPHLHSAVVYFDSCLLPDAREASVAYAAFLAGDGGGDNEGLAAAGGA